MTNDDTYKLRYKLSWPHGFQNLFSTAAYRTGYGRQPILFSSCFIHPRALWIRALDMAVFLLPLKASGILCLRFLIYPLPSTN